jgi:hypothetical protein
MEREYRGWNRTSFPKVFPVLPFFKPLYLPNSTLEIYLCSFSASGKAFMTSRVYKSVSELFMSFSSKGSQVYKNTTEQESLEKK